MRHVCSRSGVRGRVAAPVGAQTVISPPPPSPKRSALAGPRFGFTLLTDGVVEELAGTQSMWADDLAVRLAVREAVLHQGSGVTVVNEWVVLIGGLDQGVAIPSLSWLVGLRTKEGAEFGSGPTSRRPAWRSPSPPA